MPISYSPLEPVNFLLNTQSIHNPYTIKNPKCNATLDICPVAKETSIVDPLAPTSPPLIHVRALRRHTKPSLVSTTSSSSPLTNKQPSIPQRPSAPVLGIASGASNRRLLPSSNPTQEDDIIDCIIRSTIYQETLLYS
jgi:hypothetical protein